MRNPWKVRALEYEGDFEEKLFAKRSAAISFAEHWVGSGWERTALLMRRPKPGRSDNAWEKSAKFSFAAGAVITTSYEQRRRRKVARRQPRYSAEVIDIGLEHSGLRKREAAKFRQCLLDIWKEAIGRGRPIELPTGKLVIHNLREARKREMAFGKRQAVLSRPTRLSFRSEKSVVFDRPATEVFNYPHTGDYYTQRPGAPPKNAIRVAFIPHPGFRRPPSRTR